MSTSESSIEETTGPDLKTDGLLNAGRIATGSQVISTTSTPDLDRLQHISLELEQAQGTKIVDMNQSDHVVATPGEKQRIGTFGLGGCTAVGVVATFPDGHRRAHVQHYDAFCERMDGDDFSLEEMVLRQEALQGRYSEASRVDAAIMVPGYLVPDEPAHVGWLTATLKQEFGNTANVHVVPYCMDEELGESAYATALLIDIPSEGSPEILPSRTSIQTL